MQEKFDDYEANEAQEYSALFNKTIHNIEDIIVKNILVTDVDDVLAGNYHQAISDYPEVFATFKDNDSSGLEIVMNLDPLNNKHHDAYYWDYRVTFFVEKGTEIDDSGIARTVSDREISYYFTKDEKTVLRFDLDFVKHGAQGAAPTSEESMLKLILGGEKVKSFDDMQANIQLEKEMGVDRVSVPDIDELRSVNDRLNYIIINRP